MNEPRLIKGFDFLAPFYDVLVKLFFGHSILKAQTHFLSEIKNVKTVLIFGGGTGRLLLECLKINNKANYCYVDISPKMIKQTKQKTSHTNVKFIIGSYNEIPKQYFDIIITPFILDCFRHNELADQVVSMLKIRLAPNGKWLFSDFNYSKKSTVANIFSRITIRFLYFIFNIICGLEIIKLPDFKQAFKQNSLVRTKHQEFRNELLASSVYCNR